MANERNVGLGPDVVMMGRFVELSGQEEVRPVARFGCIANPEVFLKTRSFGNPQEALVVECHSVPGFTGSPVLIFIPSLTAATEDAIENSVLGPYLLGVVWRQHGDPETWS